MRRDTSTLSDALLRRLAELYPNTFAHVAARCGVSVQRLADWRDGRAWPPAGDQRAKHLAAVLGIREPFRRQGKNEKAGGPRVIAGTTGLAAER